MQTTCVLASCCRTAAAIAHVVSPRGFCHHGAHCAAVQHRAHSVPAPRPLSRSQVRLDVAGVQHDAHGGTESLGGQVHGELGADRTVGSVRPGDAAPDHAEAAAVLLSLGLEDVGDALAHVELGRLLILHTLDVHDVGVAVLVDLRPAKRSTGRWRQQRRTGRAR